MAYMGAIALCGVAGYATGNLLATPLYRAFQNRHVHSAFA